MQCLKRVLQFLDTNLKIPTIVIAFHCCIVGRRESGLHRTPRPQELLYGGRVHVDAM